MYDYYITFELEMELAWLKNILRQRILSQIKHFLQGQRFTDFRKAGATKQSIKYTVKPSHILIRYCGLRTINQWKYETSQPYKAPHGG